MIINLCWCWWKSHSFKIYLSQSLSSWGDRMWSFAVGIYLFYLYPESLQVTAIYGFARSISVIILGALIGKWIDKTQRLRAAQISLIVQNLSVILCAILFIIQIEYENDIQLLWNGVVENILIVVIILMGVIANLGTVATKIALEKDWIVVLADGDENKLAKMNSVMRTIDLTTSIVSPIIVGQILEFAGNIYSAIFIGAWNLVSVVVEYYILISLYREFPQLGKKQQMASESSEPSKLSISSDKADVKNSPVENQLTEQSFLNRRPSDVLENYNSINNTPAAINEKENQKSKSTVNTFFIGIKENFQGTTIAWKAYFTHDVRNAGIALALLYLTVLGFDNITRGFALSQGVSEMYLGIFTAIGAIFGILGSLTFPAMRRTFGYLTTGNIGFGSETFTLLFCIASIFAKGSPFELYDEIFGESSIGSSNNNSSNSDDNVQQFYNLTELWNNNISVLLFLTGIVTARFGLWIADLSVSQIFQEQIAENQRGIINGVQSSVNLTMDLIQYTLVIILPNSYQFGYLIAVSWLAIVLGWIFFMIFCCQKKGKRKPIISVNNLTVPVPSISSNDIEKNNSQEISDLAQS